MGLGKLETLSTELINAGLPPDTPAVAIANGTMANQRQCISTLSELPEAVKGIDLKPPVLCVIGHVVSLAQQLNWQGLRYEGEDQDDQNAKASA